MIRTLDPVADLEAVAALYAQAADFWIMTDRKLPDRQKASEFFTDTPPGCDAALSYRLGYFTGSALVGVADLSFGFPEPDVAYMGLMLFTPSACDQGFGPVFLAEIERLARLRGSTRLLLAVLEENTGGWRFWLRQGFSATGLTGFDAETGHTLHRFSKVL